MPRSLKLPNGFWYGFINREADSRQILCIIVDKIFNISIAPVRHRGGSLVNKRAVQETSTKELQLKRSLIPHLYVFRVLDITRKVVWFTGHPDNSIEFALPIKVELTEAVVPVICGYTSPDNYGSAVIPTVLIALGIGILLLVIDNI
jgi:hypothetical protein